MKVFAVVDGIAIGEREVTKAGMLKQLGAKKHVDTFDPSADPPRNKHGETIKEGDVVIVTTK